MLLNLKLALRNLSRNVRRTVLTMLLIGFSLTALILTDALVLGMLDLMIGTVTKNLVGEAQLHRPGFRDNFDVNLYMEGSDQLEAELSADTDVKAHATRVISAGMIASSYNLAGGLFYGVDADSEAGLSNIEAAIVEGNYLSGEEGEILLGRSLAELLEVRIGDRIVVTLTEADTDELAQALFRVSGLFHFGFREFDDSFVFVNIGDARKTLGMSDSKAHEIAVTFNDPDLAANSEHRFFSQYSSDRVEALSWLKLNEAIGYMIEMSGYSSFIVGVVLFILASLGVINSMFMSIYERIYEFGVAKAIGTRPSALAALIMSEALLIGVGSCIFGMALGYALGSYTQAYGVPLGEFEVSGVAIGGSIKSVLSVNQFVQFPIYVLLLTLAAALYPARFAARIIPTEALQRSL